MSGKIIWIYGMSGAGKTTLANRLARELEFFIVDGDVVRQMLGASKDFSRSGRIQHQNALRKHLNHLRSIGDRNFVVASITPYEEMRRMNRLIFKEDYYEVRLDCSLNILIDRDPKGLYKRALKGEIDHFTGISDDFELGNPDLIINTNETSENESYRLLLKGVQEWLDSRR